MTLNASFALRVGLGPAARNMHAHRQQRIHTNLRSSETRADADAEHRAAVTVDGVEAVAGRGLLVHSAAAGPDTYCKFNWIDGASQVIETALAQTSCPEVEVWLGVPVALLDTASLSAAFPKRVTIRGTHLASGKIPTLQVRLAATLCRV